MNGKRSHRRRRAKRRGGVKGKWSMSGVGGGTETGTDNDGGRGKMMEIMKMGGGNVDRLSSRRCRRRGGKAGSGRYGGSMKVSRRRGRVRRELRRDGWNNNGDGTGAGSLTRQR